MRRTPTPRAAARALLAAVLFLPLIPGRVHAEAPLPFTLLIEVVWGAESNRETYRQDLQSMILQDLVGHNCYRSVVTEPSADMTLRVRIDVLDVEEDMEFRGPPSGGPGEYVSLGATVTVAGRIDLVAPDGSSVRETRRFRRVVRADPRMAGDEPMSRAVVEALNEPVRWAEKLACGKREQLLQEAAKAGVKPPPQNP